MVPSRRHPTHPGEILEEEFLKPLGLTPKEFAKKLGTPWTELHIQAILKGKEGISEKTSDAFAKVLNTPAAFWNRIEQQYYQYNHTHKNVA